MADSQNNRTLAIIISLVLLGVAGTLAVRQMLPRPGAQQLGLMGVMSDGLAAEITTLNQGPARIVCVSRENSPSVFASAKAVGMVAVSFEGERLDELLGDGVVDLAVVFHESTPVSNPDITPEELQQFVSFRHARE